MEKVYRLLDWLDMDQAVDWLSTLTETPISQWDLYGLILSKQCNAYIHATGLQGHYINDDGHEVGVIGRGFQLVLDIETIRKASRENSVPHKRQLSLEGSRYEPDPRNIEVATRAGYDYWEVITEDEEGYPPYFRPADIQLLADKMNGVTHHTRDVETLRKELEQEQAAREAAEAELSERRALDGKRSLDHIRHALSYDRKEFSAMQKRAEQAEQVAKILDRQLTEQKELTRRQSEILAEMAKRVSEHRSGQQQGSANEANNLANSCVTFPYATKELETMRAVATKYWKGYTTDKRQPTQKEIGLEIGELLGLPRQASGDPARKAIVLAAAIKPDTLPDA